MRSYTVRESSHARRDLDAAVSYLVDTLKNVDAAKNLLLEYEKLIASLEGLPSSHPLVRDELLAYAGYRWAGFSSYMAFFTVNEEARAVDIHRIFHESRNWTQLLK